MNNALITTSPGRSPADIFFDRPIYTSDWDTIRSSILAGKVTTAQVLAEIKAMEPLAEEDPRDLEHWRKQQILRLCLLHGNGKPMELDRTCGVCGERKVDPVFGDGGKWKEQCLHCAEEDKQTYNGGSRGSCEFIKPAYNARSKCWGLLYYWSHGYRDTFMFLAVDGYSTRQDAQSALQPVKHYVDWLNVKYKGMITYCIRFNHLFDLDDFMQMSLPLTPQQFHHVLRSKIAEDMVKDPDVMGYYVKDALRDHAREEKDA